MKLKFVTLLAAIALIALVGYKLYHQTHYGTLNLTVVPNDAKIQTDTGTSVKNNSDLKAGDYKLVISRQDFDSKTITASIDVGKKFSLTLALAPNDAAGIQWLRDHPDQAAIVDGIGSSDANAIADANAKKYPILSALPTFAQLPVFWRIDYGKSAKYPNDSSKIALYITADTDAARQAAQQWMISHGYNPASYEIIYQSSAAYMQQAAPPVNTQNLGGE